MCSTIFRTLNIYGSDYQTIGIVTPPRRQTTPAHPLHGLRFAVKDAYRIRGLKTSLGNKAYLSVSSPAETTATVIFKLLEAGANLVGMTKLSTMIGREEPAEAVDYHVPFNPRADGYQSPAGSSSGSAASVAASSWLDFVVGTDTTGSGRRPALVNGVFQMRPTHNLVSLDGIVPVFPQWDAPVVYTRDIALLKPIISTWLESKEPLTPREAGKLPAIIYP